MNANREDAACTESDEHVFVEEQEPSGRLVLPPCITCGMTAMDALDILRRERDEWEAEARA